MNGVVSRRRFDNEQHRKFARLLTDLSRSFDSAKENYEMRQVQQQFSIESPLPLPQPTHKNQLPYGEKTSFHFSGKSFIF